MIAILTSRMQQKFSLKLFPEFAAEKLTFSFIQYEIYTNNNIHQIRAASEEDCYMVTGFTQCNVSLSIFPKVQISKLLFRFKRLKTLLSRHFGKKL